MKLADVAQLPGYQVIAQDCPQWKRALIEKKNASLLSEATVTIIFICLALTLPILTFYNVLCCAVQVRLLKVQFELLLGPIIPHVQQLSPQFSFSVLRACACF